MNTRQVYSRLPEEARARLARQPLWRGGPDPGGISRDRIREVRGELTAPVQDILAFIVRSCGPRPFSEEKLTQQFAAAAGRSVCESRLACDELRREGILFTVRKSWGECLHFIPADAYSAWNRELAPVVPQPCKETAGIRVTSPYKPRLSLQLLGMMAELAKQGIPITAKGLIAKKAAAAASSRLAYTEADLAVFRSANTDSSHYAVSFAVGLDAVVRTGLLELGGTSASWKEPELAEWLALPDGQRECRLLDWTEERFAAYDERFACSASLLRGLRAGSWYSRHELEQWVKAAGGAACGEWLTDWLDLMAAFGWLQTGRSGKGVELVRWIIYPLAEEIPTPHPAAGSVLVLTGGELAVPHDTDYRSRWEIELMAEPERDGPMTIYKYSQATISRAADNGRTFEQLIDRLAAASGSPLPEHAFQLLEEWGRAAGRVRFADVTIMSCQDEPAADRAAADPSVARLLIRRLGKLDFLIERSNIPLLRKHLSAAGLEPSRLMGGDTHCPYPLSAFGTGGELLQGAAENAFTDYRDSAGLLQHPCPLYLYALEPVPTDKEKRLPGTADIPAAWLQAMRDYHPSTRKEILKRAIELGVLVKLDRHGSVIDFIPRRLEEEGGNWFVAGQLSGEGDSSLRLTPDMWSRMQLAIPPGLPAK
ncbi:helicase-associated domain-containing protein [Paenibacillus tarimensis]|uniref:helicase-associated domain-containing protein n=1 Tax=Paenibacillus tarimensis TaxID=416012 RepID=UPI001F328469|nr:helicase-associated domain-containing protein [Paenibacillus tarimensis]MCF2942206.1 helicase-associated domain-containing protein [Paenibacillus tarimensis]